MLLDTPALKSGNPYEDAAPPPPETDQTDDHTCVAVEQPEVHQPRRVTILEPPTSHSSPRSSSLKTGLLDTSGNSQDSELGMVNTREDEEEQEEKASKCATAWRYYKLVFVSVSLVLAIFDLGADWWAVKDFFRYEDGNKLTIALTFFISCSSVLFFMECYNGVVSVRVYGFKQGNRDKVELWREFLSLGLLLLEDLPVTIIMYSTFSNGNCELYLRIFEQSQVARMALLAAFISSLWKGVLSLKYCLQVVFKENYNPWKKKNKNRKRFSHPDSIAALESRQSGYYSKTRSKPRLSRQVSMTWQDRIFCCSCVRCRPLRIVINGLVCLFTGYVFLTFVRSDLLDRRPECHRGILPNQDQQVSNLSFTSYFRNATTQSYDLH